MVDFIAIGYWMIVSGISILVVGAISAVLGAYEIPHPEWVDSVVAWLAKGAIALFLLGYVFILMSGPPPFLYQ